MSCNFSNVLETSRIYYHSKVGSTQQSHGKPVYYQKIHKILISLDREKATIPHINLYTKHLTESPEHQRTLHKILISLDREKATIPHINLYTKHLTESPEHQRTPSTRPVVFPWCFGCSQVTSAPTSSWPKSLTTCMKIHDKTCGISKSLDMSHINKPVGFLHEINVLVCLLHISFFLILLKRILLGRLAGQANDRVWSFQESNSKCLNNGFAEGCWNKKQQPYNLH